MFLHPKYEGFVSLKATVNYNAAEGGNVAKSMLQATNLLSLPEASVNMFKTKQIFSATVFFSFLSNSTFLPCNPHSSEAAV